MKSQLNHIKCGGFRLLLVSSVIFAMFTLLMTCASASGIPMEGTAGGSNWSLVDWWDKLHTVYDMFATLSLPLGAISFAFGAFKMMTSSDEKEQAQGKAFMKLTLITVIAIQILPLVLQFGFDVTSGYHWDPYNP